MGPSKDPDRVGPRHLRRRLRSGRVPDVIHIQSWTHSLRKAGRLAVGDGLWRSVTSPFSSEAGIFSTLLLGPGRRPVDTSRLLKENQALLRVQMEHYSRRSGAGLKSRPCQSCYDRART